MKPTLTRTLLLGTFGLLALACIGCSGSSPVAPSSTADGSTRSESDTPFSTLDNRPAPGLPEVVGDGRNSCPSDAPVNLTANAQGQLRRLPNGLNEDAVLRKWTPVANRSSYEVQSERAGVPQTTVNTEAASFTSRLVEGTWRYRVRARAAGLCETAGNWSDWAGFSVTSAPFAGTPAPVKRHRYGRGWQRNGEA